MKLDYLIDTNILISLFNDELVEPVPNGNLGYSVITEIELLSFSGLEKDEETLIQNSLKSLSQIPLNFSITEKTIQLRRQYRLKMPDAIIAASAWDCKAVLLSNDRQLAQINEIQIVSLETKLSREPC